MFDGMFEIFNEEEKEEKQSSQDTEVTYPSHSSDSSNIFVVSVGGSILMREKPDIDSINAISQCLNELIASGHRLVLVVGGGKTARNYVNVAKALGANNFELDELGIRITRANASLLLSSIDNAFPEVLTDIKKSRDVLNKGKTPIFGGLMPGFTTDAVGALLAEYLGAKFINLSNVDGIFTADPAAHPSARLYHELSYDKLLEILTSNAMKPGQNLILDLPAVMILKRSSITAFFLNGHDLENLKSAVSGMNFKGTLVGPASEESFGEEEESPPVKKRAARKKTVKKKGKKKYVPFVDDEDSELDPDKIRF